MMMSLSTYPEEEYSDGQCLSFSWHSLLFVFYCFSSFTRMVPWVCKPIFHYLFMLHCRVKPFSMRNGQDPIPRASLPKSEWPLGQTDFKYPSHSAVMKKLLISTQRSRVNKWRHDPAGEYVSIKHGGGRGGKKRRRRWSFSRIKGVFLAALLNCLIACNLIYGGFNTFIFIGSHASFTSNERHKGYASFTKPNYHWDPAHAFIAEIQREIHWAWSKEATPTSQSLRKKQRLHWH